MAAWPHEVEVLIEVPRGGSRPSRRRRGFDVGALLPSPFNYGSVLGTVAEDGDPEDVIVLGPRLPIGTRARFPVRGMVRFVDDGKRDDKWVVSPWPPARGEWWAVQAFFLVYPAVKRASHRLRNRDGRTAFEGIERVSRR
jgi:inorganic pyrophosphatase